jgi:RNA polymerase sigma factor (sigma-70 family)
MKYDFTLTQEQQELVENHLHLLHWTIRRYIDADETVVGLGYEDLYQEASIGLCRAAATYDGGSAQFSTYAITVIRNHLLDHCRKIQANRKNLPVISMEDHQGELPVSATADETDTVLSEMASAEMLAHFKRRYGGTVRLGIEALEWKVKGYGVSDIAQLYHMRPNYIGACISRAAERLRQEREASEFFLACCETILLPIDEKGYNSPLPK